MQPTQFLCLGSKCQIISKLNLTCVRYCTARCSFLDKGQYLIPEEFVRHGLIHRKWVAEKYQHKMFMETQTQAQS